ncbi:MAG TPA: CopG family ribbon-helix-helix protein [Candidatus Thermoplasmatota archaeon]|nr:CopG family ribbon-helix-helix protein [Candidatus Thermoplasmatota archaeon]
MAVVSVSLPDALLEQADAFIEERGFAGRSDLVRAALRDFLARERAPAQGGQRTATLTLVYPEGFERKIGEIRHDHTDVVKSMMHGHSRDHCVEVFVLEGSGKRIQQFVDQLRAARETLLAQATWTDPAGRA